MRRWCSYPSNTIRSRRSMRARPARAGEALVAAYERRMATLMPDRDARREALAAKLGLAD